MLRAEEAAGALFCNGFHLIRINAAAVIAFAGIPLRIFVGENGSGSAQNRFGDDIFRGNQLNIVLLAAQLALARGKHFRVIPVQRIIKHGSTSLSHDIWHKFCLLFILL